MVRSAVYLKAAFLASATLSLAAGNVAFLKYPDGRAISGKTGKPMAIFLFVDEKGNTPSC